MKIFIHIGAPRTGTTTLQSLMTKNRRTLLDLGLDYPAIALLHPTDGIAQHKLPYSLQPEWPEFAIKARTAASDAWGELRKYLATARTPIFLSSETFSSLPATGIEFIARFFKTDDVTVIYVRRDPNDWRRSMREQRIIWGFAEDKLPETPAVDLAEDHLQNWRNHFHVEEIPYGTDSTRAVLAVAGIDMDNLKAVENRNTQTPKDVLELLARLNRIPMAEQNRFHFNQTIIQWRREKL